MLEYLHAFNQGLINILPFSPQGTETFLYMMFGMAIGFAVGILPGLGGATTLALMLPFIYNMTRRRRSPSSSAPTPSPPRPGISLRFSSEFRAKAYAPRRLSMAIPWPKTAKPAARSAQRS